MVPTKKCPVCGSINLTAERRIDGITSCNHCKYAARHSAFNVVSDQAIIPYISHDDIRKELGTWSRSARQMMRNYVTQYENEQRRLNADIEDYKKLANLYKQLATLRNEQLKDIPFSERGTTVDLDVYTCEKIKKLRTKMGLDSEG